MSAADEIWYCLYFTEDGSYSKLPCSKLEDWKIEDIRVGDTRKMRWEENKAWGSRDYDAACIMIAPEDAVDDLLDDLDECMKIVASLGLPVPTKAARQTPRRSKGTATPSRFSWDTSFKEKRAEVKTRSGPVSRRSSVIATDEEASSSKRSRTEQTTASRAVSPAPKKGMIEDVSSTATTVYHESCIRLGKAEKTLKDRKRMLELAKKDVEEAEKEREEARAHHETAWQAKEKEDLEEREAEEKREEKVREDRILREEKEKMEKEEKKRKEKEEEERLNKETDKMEKEREEKKKREEEEEERLLKDEGELGRKENEEAEKKKNMAVEDIRVEEKEIVNQEESTESEMVVDDIGTVENVIEPEVSQNPIPST